MSESRTIAVLAPSPLVTVTIEERGGRDEVHFHAGGQGIWIARMIASLGARPVICAPFGGESGRVLRHLVEQELPGIRSVEVRDASAGYVHDRRGGTRRVLAESAGPSLSRHEIDDLYDTFLVAALAAGAAVLTGSAEPGALDADVPRRLALDLGRNGRPVVADLSGPFLRAMGEGLAVLKVSHDELAGAGYCAGAEDADVAAAIRALNAQGIANVVVSRGDRPALARFDGQFLEARGPRIEAAGTQGTGDSMTAAMAVAVANGTSLRGALELGVAAGAMNATRSGLGTGRSEHVAAFVPRVTIRERADLA